MRPVSNQTKTLRGTVRRDRQRTMKVDIPMGTSTTESVPIELSGNRQAVLEWQRINAAIVRRYGGASELDRALRIAYCLEWSTYVRAAKACAKGKLEVTRGSGGKGIAPAAAIASRTAGMLLRLADALALTASAQNRIAAVGPAQSDAFEEFDHPESVRPN